MNGASDLLFEFNLTLEVLTASDGPSPYPIFLDWKTEAADRSRCLFSTPIFNRIDKKYIRQS